jgi:hypothetical protein
MDCNLYLRIITGAKRHDENNENMDVDKIRKITGKVVYSVDENVHFGVCNILENEIVDGKLIVEFECNNSHDNNSAVITPFEYFSCFPYTTNHITYDIRIISDCKILCAGELVEQTTDGNLYDARYVISTPTLSTSVVVVINDDFNYLPITNGFVFYREITDIMIVTVNQIMEFFSLYCGVSYPLKLFRLIITNDIYSEYISGSSILIIKNSLVHDPYHIDYIHSIPRNLAYVISQQWFGEYVFPKAWPDVWLTVALGQYTAGLYAKKIYGSNNYKIGIKASFEELYYLPPRPILKSLDEFEEEDLKLDMIVEKKAPVFLYLIDRLGKHLVQKAVNKILVGRISGDIAGLSTQYFIKLLKKLTPREIPVQYLSNSSLPSINISWSLNRKKNIIEISVEQDVSKDKYIGNITIRIHEPDGTFDHVIHLEEPSHKYDLIYHTKYKRLRLNKKDQIKALKAEEEQRARLANKSDRVASSRNLPPNTEFHEELCRLDPEVKEILDKVEWQDGLPTDAENLITTQPISWIRVDPETNIPCLINYSQTEVMWMYMLHADKDVIAQYDVMRGGRF